MDLMARAVGSNRHSHTHRTAIVVRWTIGVLAIVLVVQCRPTPNDWTGHVYPDRSNLLRQEALGNFDSLEACREAAVARLREIGADSSGDYECGFKCRPLLPELGAESVLVCETTER